MNIVVVGAGVVGQSLAEQLSVEGHRISIVDRDRSKLRAIGEKLDVLCVRGNASTPSVLKRAGIEKAQMVIAVTDLDEVNMVVGMVADRLGVEHTIARVRNPEYFGESATLSMRQMGIDQVIDPARTIVDAMVRTIETPGTYHLATLAGGQMVILGFNIAKDSPAAGLTMAELREIGNIESFLVLDINRGDQVIVPRGPDTIEPGDSVHVLCSAKTTKLVTPIIHAQPPVVNVVIIGGASRIGVQLAEAIRDRVERVVLIEPDPAAAEEAAERLGGTLVLNGEPTDLDVLEEASLDKCDLFCALSDNDQSNIMSVLLAKKHSKAVAAALVHQPEYVPVLSSLGMEIVINPRLITVGEILMHVRRGHVQSVTRLAQGRAEILELEVPDASPATRTKLRELRFPEHALLGAIVHDGVMRIPDGDSKIEPGDTVVVFALPDAIPGIEKLFSRRRWFQWPT
ncbi:MAG: Trk system potassium transporter TrkA [Polyangiaceae bacterium]|nr:Trk system potassium transporter TrkA [Polyangiaceae bacterium]